MQPTPDNDHILLFTIPNDVLIHLASFLDGKSKAAFWSTCQRLRGLGKRFPPVWATELQKLLQQDPRDDFGIAGTMEALALVPPNFLWDAFKMLIADNPKCNDTVSKFLIECLFPVSAWFDCRSYCRVSEELFRIDLREEDLTMGAEWEPPPAAIYLALCVVDYYLPRLVSSKQQVVQLGLCQSEPLSPALETALSVRCSRIQCTAQLYCRCPEWKDFQILHPIHDIHLLSHVNRLGEHYFKEAQEYLLRSHSRQGEVLKHGGFYEQNGRVHHIPFEFWKNLFGLGDISQNGKPVKKTIKSVLKGIKKQAIKEAKEFGRGELAYDFLIEGQDLYTDRPLYKSVHSLASALPAVMKRFLLGPSGFLTQELRAGILVPSTERLCS